MLEQNILDMRSLFPELILLVTFAVMFLVDLFIGSGRKKGLVWIGLGGLGVVLWALSLQGKSIQVSGPASLFSGMMVLDSFSVFFKWIFVLTTACTLLMASRSREIETQNEGEFYLLTVLICFGMFLLSSSTHLLMILLSFEMISVLSYVLAGYLKGDPRSSESGIKYVIYGAFTTGIMIYGMSLMYGLTGSLQIEEIHNFLTQAGAGTAPVTVILLMVSAGMLYKIAAVPFHMWSPDVYEGAPTVATAFFSVGPKAAGFAVFIRFFLVTFGYHFEVDWRPIIEVISIATMTIGNYTALRQENLKRMLAYSSIAHAGYLLMGLAVFGTEGRSAILFYLVVYMVMNLGAFLVVQSLENTLHSSDLLRYRGLGPRAPIPGLAMVIFMISLAGLPPTAGFIGKFFLFKAVVDQRLYLFAVIGLVNSVVSLVYYMRVVKVLYLDRPSDDVPEGIEVSFLYRVLLVLLAVPLIYFGLFFQPIYDLSAQAVFG